MGAELLKRGWQGPTGAANVDAPGTVEEIHRAYVSAGAELVHTNTFMASYCEASVVREILERGVLRARTAAPRAFVVLSIGPRPDLPAQVAREIIRAANEIDVDAIVFETISTDDPLRSRVWDESFVEIALPVFFSWVPKAEMLPVTDAGMQSIGLNCGAGPGVVLGVARRVSRYSSSMPLSLRPSAGLPTGEGRSLQWPVPPAAFGDFAEAAHALRARIIGGCCGASPAHIAAVADRLRVLPKSSQS